MNLRDLQYLVAVADIRHFGRAADACGVSQPTLSTQLAKLERELGADLLERGRKVMLTAAGEQVVQRARVILDEADGILQVARQAEEPESGTVRLGLFPTLAPYLLPHVAPMLRERFPHMELLLVEEKSAVLLQQLREGALDAAVLAQPVQDSQLVQEYLFSEDFVLAVPADHPLAPADGGTDAVADVSVLAGEQVLLLDEGHCLRDQALDVCRLAGATERAGIRATSTETLRQMVAGGVGVTLLPQLAALPPASLPAGVRLVRFTDPAPQRSLAMFWRPSSAQRALLPKVAEVLRTVPNGVLQQVCAGP
ncbi:MAG TPA: LysR substrate-binding domain-containing protein [Actinomycetales bacterium]|nr:LysR substrate-binding domain-containing protein [Actinomycetales bacterium]